MPTNTIWPHILILINGSPNTHGIWGFFPIVEYSQLWDSFSKEAWNVDF